MAYLLKFTCFFATFIGGITNWQPRVMKIDFSFLPAGKYNLTLFTDGVNAHKFGEDYERKILEISSGETMEIKLAEGGGFAGKLEKIEQDS